MNVHRVRSAGEPAFDGLLRLYTAAHPASVRKNADALRRMIERPEYLFLAAVDADVVGFAIAMAFVDCDAALLEYMAVDPERQGKGIGRLLFRAITGWPEASERFLLVEVDSHRAAAGDGADRDRRKEFYRRLGCREIDGLTYVMPPVSSATPPLMEMLVYRRDLPESVEKSRVRNWIEACYAQVYEQSIPDARIAAMLDGLPEAIRLV